MADRIPPFAEMIRARMDERGMGLRELCRAVDLDPSFFSKVLAGKRSPPSEEAVLRKIAVSLELDATRVVVSAGRIPSEWRGVMSDEALFSSVHRLAAGAPARRSVPAPTQSSAQSAPARKSNWGARSSAPASPSRDFGDELL